MTLRDDTSLSPITRAVSSAASVVPALHGSGQSQPRVSVVIPTADRDEHHVDSLLERLPAVVDEVILVDGRSSARHDRAALRAGFAAARGECIVMIDARDGVDRGAIGHFIESLQAGCEFVKCSRFAHEGSAASVRAATA